MTVRKITACAGVGLSLLAFAAEAAAQEPGGAERPGFRGLAVKAHLIRTGGWSFTEAYPGERAAKSSNDGAAGLGLELSYAFRPSVAVTVSADLNLYGHGDFSAFMMTTAGAELRRPLTKRLMPALDLAIGRFEDSGGRSYPVAVLGGAVEYFPFRRLALRFAGQLSRTVGHGTREDGSRTAIVRMQNHPERLFVGLAWYLGTPQSR